MRYLCLLIGEPGIEGPVPGTPEFAQMLSDYESATRAMAADGALVDSGPLQPPSSAATLRVRDGRPLVTDGPSPSSRSRSAATTCWSAPTWTRRCGGPRPSRRPATGRSRCAP